MAWERGRTGSNIPQRIKDTVNQRQRDICATINPAICWGTIDEYDHIVNVKASGKSRRELERDPDLLQGLCKPCHQAKTQLEARAGRTAWKRKPEPHPGLIR